MEHPNPEIASVDQLHRLVERIRNEDPVLITDSIDPVREPIGWVVGTHDQSRTNDQSAIAERGVNLVFAQSLERTVRLAGDLLGGGVLDRSNRGGLVRACVIERLVHADSRYEKVASDSMREGPSGVSNHSRHVAAEIDHRVPLTISKHIHPAVTVCRYPFDVGEKVGASLSTVEQGHDVTVQPRVFNKMTADEYRATQNQDSHYPDDAR